MPVDRSASSPLHAQIAATLRAEIRDHVIPPGETLPSEAALRARFGVSRSVIRQALATLVDQGVVRRDAGRAPVVVAGVEHSRLVQSVTGLFDQFSGGGLALRTRVARLEVVTAPSRVAHHLGTRQVLRMERVRSIEEGPLSHVRTWLPADRVEGLTAEALTDTSLHRVLEARYGIRPVTGRRQIRAVPADAAIAAELGVTPGAPLLLLEGSSFDQHGAPVEWFESWHRSDRVVFDVQADENAQHVRLHPDRSLLSGAATPAGTPDDLDRARHLLAELRAELDRLSHGNSRPGDG